jgi:hypothetical protein
MRETETECAAASGTEERMKGKKLFLPPCSGIIYSGPTLRTGDWKFFGSSVNMVL